MRKPFFFTTSAIEDLEIAIHEGDDVWLWDSGRRQHSGLGLRMRHGARGTSRPMRAWPKGDGPLALKIASEWTGTRPT
jgi:hypothetical protein